MIYPLSTFLDNKNTLRYKNQQELFIKFLKKRKIEERQKYSFKNPKEMVKKLCSTHDDGDNDDKNTDTYFDNNFENTYNKFDEYDDDDFEK